MNSLTLDQANVLYALRVGPRWEEAWRLARRLGWGVYKVTGALRELRRKGYADAWPRKVGWAPGHATLWRASAAPRTTTEER